MLALITKILSGSLLDGIFDIAKAYINKEITKEEARVKMIGLLVPAFVEGFKQQGQVILAELKSDSWFVRSWRAIVGFSAWFIILWYAWIVPILVAWLAFPPPRVGDDLLNWVFQMATIGVGGYVGGTLLKELVALFKR